MFYIRDALGLFFAGLECGCVIWKGHHTRGAMYNTREAAQKDVTFLKLEDVEIVSEDDVESAFVTIEESRERRKRNPRPKRNAKGES